MTTINFEPIEANITLKFTCSDCGKKKQRVIKEEQTVNPYNKNEKGIVKTEKEVIKSVGDKLFERCMTFEKEPFCSSCKQFLGY